MKLSDLALYGPVVWRAGTSPSMVSMASSRSGRGRRGGCYGRFARAAIL
ncbi:hypothetical protein ACFP4H_10850 [Pseudophaeobacter arcticus]